MSLRSALGSIIELQTVAVKNPMPLGCGMLTVGIAMLQGARHEHMYSILKAAERINTEIVIRELRKASDVEGVDAFILPGGESTAMKIASRSENLYSKIWEHIRENETPVLGTCAGAILLSQQGLIETSIERNAFGRQKESFQAEIKISLDGISNFPGVFIRAPRFLEGSKHPIAWLEGEVVGVLEGNTMAITFHPELTENYEFHIWLLNRAKQRE
tara:strand:+ start:7757 stop:8404 length:648 start_codon:yes stop_codon:yes gene_type:complete